MVMFFQDIYDAPPTNRLLKVVHFYLEYGFKKQAVL